MKILSDAAIGLGQMSTLASINVYIANRPPLDQYQSLTDVLALKNGDIAYIAQHTGNHWRKIFNVYAKFLFILWQKKNSLNVTTTSWQAYRDNELLQSHCQEALLFSPPNISKNNKAVHIIMGKQYGEQLSFCREDKNTVQIDRDFALQHDKKIIFCPYFDYRQLSNIKIETLVQLVLELSWFFYMPF